MSKEKIKVYLYTRVSTTMQIDGYSLDAQKTKMKAFCDYNEYKIVGEYEDAGKSGKSIEGRVSFNQMMEDIKSGKDGVSYVLVFKLSRFGRNAADVLATLQVMQDFGVNLICVEDGIDSSKDAGKLMISVLSAVAEIERENIRVQTMEGRMQKAREGKWNGGFAPYGYSLIDGKLVVNEEEAVAIRMIFDQYVNTDLGANGIAKYLENHGIHKIARQNGKNPLFDLSHLTDECQEHEKKVKRPVVFTETAVAEVINAYDKILIEGFNVSEMRKLYEVLYDSSERNAKYTSWQSIKLIEAILAKLSLSVNNLDITSVMSPLYILHDYRILLDHLLSADKISDTKQHIVATLGVQSFNDQESIYNEEIKRLNTLFNYLGVLSK